jgi:enoyl-CoA hydratase
LGARRLDVAVKVVIITGAGEKSFVAGADVKEMEPMDSVQAHAFARTGQRVMLFIQK